MKSLTPTQSTLSGRLTIVAFKVDFLEDLLDHRKNQDLNGCLSDEQLQISRETGTGRFKEAFLFLLIVT